MATPLQSAATTARFQAAQAGLPGHGLDWLEHIRAAGMSRFGELGFPSPRIEAWKYTDLRPLEKLALDPAAAATDAAVPAPLLDGRHRLVFVNGRYNAGLSTPGLLPPGVELTSLAALLQQEPQALRGRLAMPGADDDQAMTALNLALMQDGLVLRLGRGVQLPAPIEVIYLGAAGEATTAQHCRNLILLDEGAQATVIEQHTGQGSYLANSVTQVRLGQGAMLRQVKVQTEAATAWHIAAVFAELGRDATYETFTLSLGGRLARSEIRVRLAGQGASCRLDGIYLGRGRQHLDQTNIVDHLAPHTTSRQLYKGALDETGRGVFQGRITVHPKAQKSDGQLLNKTLLLSAGAEMDTKPELEIYADDVKCGHGAATGDLDAAQLFYLRSRGMPEALARRVLVEAFVGEVIDGLPVAALQEPLRAQAGQWLAAWSDAETQE